jgi:hypothetical protein
MGYDGLGQIEISLLLKSGTITVFLNSHLFAI